MSTEGDLLHVVTSDKISDKRHAFGRAIIWVSFALLVLTAALQYADKNGQISLGFETWRPTLFAYIVWAICLCWSQVIIRGEQGKRVLFVLPAALFVISMVVFPLLFGVSIAFSDWNLSSLEGRKFNAWDNARQMWADPFYWNALRNMVWYIAAILVEYAIAFGLALMLASRDQGAQILPRRVPAAADAVAGGGQLDDRQSRCLKSVSAHFRASRAALAGTARRSSARLKWRVSP